MPGFAICRVFRRLAPKVVFRVLFSELLSHPVVLALSNNQICGRPSRSLWLAICGALSLGAWRVGSLALGSTATPRDGSEGGSLAEAAAQSSSTATLPSAENTGPLSLSSSVSLLRSQGPSVQRPGRAGRSPLLSSIAACPASCAPSTRQVLARGAQRSNRFSLQYCSVESRSLYSVEEGIRLGEGGSTAFCE